jgi:hypothetical protein
MPGDITQYLKDKTFDADAVRAMDEAYDKARRMLHGRSQSPVFLEVLAKRIVYWATTGERNSDELARRALHALGYDPDQL